MFRLSDFSRILLVLSVAAAQLLATGPSPVTAVANSNTSSPNASHPSHSFAKSQTSSESPGSLKSCCSSSVVKAETKSPAPSNSCRFRKQCSGDGPCCCQQQISTGDHRSKDSAKHSGFQCRCEKSPSKPALPPNTTTWQELVASGRLLPSTFEIAPPDPKAGFPQRTSDRLPASLDSIQTRLSLLGCWLT